MNKALVVLSAILLAACAVTEKTQPKAGENTGFLRDYSQLTPGDKDQAGLVYWNPNAQWGKYSKVILDPITLVGPEGQMDPADQARLSKYYYDKLHQDLSQHFAIVDQPAPDVMRVRVALTDAEAATQGLRTVSVVIPQARLLNAGYEAASGSYAFVGSAQSEGEIVDSMTNERLAAAVDRRYGGLSIKNADVWKWGDAEHIMDYWSETLSNRLAERHTAALGGAAPASGSSAK